jgi:hypothetical protein
MTRRHGARPRRWITRAALLAPVLLVAAVAYGADPEPSRPSSPVATTITATLPPGSDVADLIGRLRVDDDQAGTDYDRARFGQRWADVDRNGCDQRNDALRIALDEVAFRAGTRDCVVERGLLLDPYTGQASTFVKGTDGGGVDIDHLVPLAHAWASGAWSWTDEQREAFANDLSLLQPTDASTNRSKGDQDITTWLPPEPSYSCTYLERWVQAKTTWNLAVTSLELDTLTALANACTT